MREKTRKIKPVFIKIIKSKRRRKKNPRLQEVKKDDYKRYSDFSNHLLLQTHMCFACNASILYIAGLAFVNRITVKLFGICRR